jgi:hypothetical protein
MEPRGVESKNGDQRWKGFLVYLVIVSVDTEGPRIPAEQLRQALHVSAADTDRMRHSYLEVREGRTTFSLYLHAPDESSAIRLADQLCRRTMASVSTRWWWAVQSARIGL